MCQKFLVVNVVYVMTDLKTQSMLLSLRRRAGTTDIDTTTNPLTVPFWEEQAEPTSFQPSQEHTSKTGYRAPDCTAWKKTANQQSWCDDKQLQTPQWSTSSQVNQGPSLSATVTLCPLVDEKKTLNSCSYLDGDNRPQHTMFGKKGVSQWRAKTFYVRDIRQLCPVAITENCITWFSLTTGGQQCSTHTGRGPIHSFHICMSTRVCSGLRDVNVIIHSCPWGSTQTLCWCPCAAHFFLTSRPPAHAPISFHTSVQFKTLQSRQPQPQHSLKTQRRLLSFTFTGRRQ